MEKKGNRNATAVRGIIDCFLKNGAVDESHGMPLSLLDLSLPEKSITFFVEDLAAGGYIRQSGGLFWFDNHKWEWDVRKLMVQHLVILFAPVVVFLLGYLFWQMLF